jgi:hypothetical protein
MIANLAKGAKALLKLLRPKPQSDSVLRQACVSASLTRQSLTLPNSTPIMRTIQTLLVGENS